MKNICNIENCEEFCFGHGLCKKHYNIKYKEKIREYKRKYKKSIKGQKSEKKYLESDKGRAASLQKVLRYQNTEKGKKVLKQYDRVRSSFKRAKIKNATPIWTKKEEITEFYNNCPEGYQVDHIIPLNNKLVCGLHVLENLQYLKTEDNLRKRNKFDGTLENNSWRNAYVSSNI